MTIPAHAICPAVNDVMETMYFVGPVYKGSGNLPAQVLGASLRFGGAFEGQFRVVVDQDCAARLAAEVLASDPSDVSAEDALAAVRELASVTCGAALSAWMPEADFRCAVPCPLTAEEMSKPLEHCFALDSESIAMGFELLLEG